MKFLKFNYFYLDFVKQEKKKKFNFFLNEKYFNIEYFKYLKKKKKNLTNIRVGVSKNPKKNSLKRNDNISIIQQYINISHKKGKKISFYKYLNIALENIFNSFRYELDHFKNYPNYYSFIYYFNRNLEFSDINFILYNYLICLESIFEIKTKKNNKKLKLKTKYSYEISYIPIKKRFRYILRSLYFYKNSFKNYSLWERLFWSIIVSLIDIRNSFLQKKKNYVYIKSIKFFKKNNN